MNSTPENPDDGTPDPEPIEPAGPPVEPVEPPVEPIAPPPAPGPVASPYSPPPQAGEPTAAPPTAFPPGPAPEPAKTGPGVWAGVGTGCGLQILGVLIFLALIGTGTSLFGWLWPFIAIPAAAAVLLIFKNLRRFATGILIVSAAMWIIVLGPCLALMTGTFV